MTLEQIRLTQRMVERGVVLELAKILTGFDQDGVHCKCAYTSRAQSFDAASLVLVTSRTPNDQLFQTLQAQPKALASAGIQQVYRIGDCDAPGLIAHAVFAGHWLARQFDAPEHQDLPYKRELPIY